MLADETAGPPAVRVYWRPGCGACRALRIALAEAGVDATWHDIWEDEAAAAYVRGVTGGAETVPTLVVGGRAMVAPSPRAALAAIGAVAPELVAGARHWPPLRIAQWATVALLLVASILVWATGRVAAGVAIYGLAVLTAVVFRRLRSRAAGVPTRER